MVWRARAKEGEAVSSLLVIAARASNLETMKPRRAAALALVGWYLMAPPVRQPDWEPAYLDEHAECRDWKTLHDFKTADECEAGRVRAKSDAENGKLTAFDGGYAGVLDVDPAPWLMQQIEAVCIANGDPRLKRK
jgi:hypothetical protein